MDLDGDGVRELVCGVTYMADGVPAVLVYRLVDGEIRQADPTAIPYELREQPSNGPAWTTYDPETNTLTTSVQFPGQEARQSFTAELDIGALEFYPWRP